MCNAVPRSGLLTPFREGTLRDIAREMIGLSERGLRRRARLNHQGEDETKALLPLIETVEEGRAPADRLLADFHGPWQGNIDRLFDAHAF